MSVVIPVKKYEKVSGNKPIVGIIVNKIYGNILDSIYDMGYVWNTFRERIKDLNGHILYNMNIVLTNLGIILVFNIKQQWVISLFTNLPAKIALKLLAICLQICLQVACKLPAQDCLQICSLRLQVKF